MRIRALLAVTIVAAFVAVACFLEPDPHANPDATLTPVPPTARPAPPSPTPPGVPAGLGGSVRHPGPAPASTA